MSFLPGSWRTWINRSAAGPFLNADSLNDWEAKFRALDCLGAVRALGLVDALPGSSVDGDAYLTSAAATPANKLVRHFGGAWESFTPPNGMVAWLPDGSAKQFLSGAWGALAAANPSFAGTLSGQSARFYDLAGPGDGVTICDSLGNVSRQTIEDFRDATLQVIPWSAAGVANGVAKLDPTGRVPSGQLPSYVDDVVEATNFAALPGTGEAGKIYITLDDNKTWRWSGSAYVEISASLALGDTSSTAYRGDRGKTAYDHSQATGNPHDTTAADVGAAKAPSKVDVSASTTLGSIDATAIKVTTTDVILTLSGGTNGTSWDIINPTASTGIAIPSGATLWKSIGSNVGPTTIALGGGRPIRITRIDANTWTMLGSQ